MLSQSDFSIHKAQQIFTDLGLDVAFLVPTPTGYQKSIMDATLPLRVLLENKGIHDYTMQKQGQLHKACVSASFIYPNDCVETTASLYRPETKNGDPRIWFRNLHSYCNPRNLLAILANGEKLFVVNLSNAEVWDSLVNRDYVYDIVKNIAFSINMAAEELRLKIEAIHHKGYFPSVTRGDTGVGMTLEYYLGIAPNSKKIPDYKGIEIKAARKLKTRNRLNLFSQVPDWQSSNITTAEELLFKYGYERDNRLQLYCTVKSITPNPQGLYFKIDTTHDTLHNLARLPVNAGETIISEVVKWDMHMLRERLTEKHNATFWVKAKSRFNNGIEEFLYESIVYTREPSVVSFTELLANGKISMDYTLSYTGSRVRDHGYLFKIMPNDLNLLFPPPLMYDFG